MWTYHPELLARAVPRYTSYPTAADFGPLDSGAIERAMGEASGDVSLYLHIPFCHRVCPYCSFYKHTPGDTPVGAFLEALLEEARQRVASLELVGQWVVSGASAKP